MLKFFVILKGWYITFNPNFFSFYFSLAIYKVKLRNLRIYTFWQITSLTDQIKSSAKTDNQNKDELNSTKSKLENTLKQLEELKNNFDQSQSDIKKLKFVYFYFK